MWNWNWVKLHRSLRSPAASAMWMRVSFALRAMPLLYYMYIYILISLIICWHLMGRDAIWSWWHHPSRGVQRINCSCFQTWPMLFFYFGKWHPSPSAPLAAGLAEMPISSFAESSKPDSIGLMWHKPPVRRNKPPVKIRTLPAFDRWFRTKQTRSSGGIFVSDLLNIQTYEIDLRCIPPKWEDGTV